jgi:hypothetical protein
MGFYAAVWQRGAGFSESGLHTSNIKHLHKVNKFFGGPKAGWARAGFHDLFKCYLS